MIHLAIHILPQEIDQLEQLVIQLKRNSVHLPTDHGIKIDVVLNTNLTDWSKSILPRRFFVDKLHDLEELAMSWAPESEFFQSDFINGCNDLRRFTIRSTNRPYVMYLDADNIFSEYFLIHAWEFCHSMEGKGYHVLTPQTTRMWDSTWDIITNYFHLDNEASHEVYDNKDPYESIMITSVKDRHVKVIQGFKFAGWGTTISSNLARLINIPDSLGSYGLDDTFIMAGCQIMKDKGYQVSQYVLENEVIIENNKFRYNPYKDYVVSIDKRQEFLAQAHANFVPELEKLKSRI